MLLNSDEAHKVELAAMGRTLRAARGGTNQESQSPGRTTLQRAGPEPELDRLEALGDDANAHAIGPAAEVAVGVGADGWVTVG